MNDTMTATGTALTAPVPTDLQALFSAPDGIKAELARIKAKAVDAAKTLDVAKAKDREAMKSVAFQVVKRKTALDAAGKELNEERRRLNAQVDDERRLVRETLDRVADDIRAPALKWEADEAARVMAIKDRLAASFGDKPLSGASADLIAVRGIVAGVPLDASWAEFLGEAEVAKARRIDYLDREISAAIEREEAAAELARLRKEAAERAEADRIAREAEAAEAAERQRMADETAAQARAAQEAAEAAQRKAEQDAAELRRQLADAQDRAARDASEAEARAEQARRDEAARIEREVAAKAQAERDEAERIRAAKIEAELKAQSEAQAKRDAAARAQAFEDNKAEIRGAIIAALAAMAGRATPEAIADALIAGAIPHCKVVL